MDRLPDVPLLRIFGLIDDHRERARLERVCRRWRQVLLKHGWKHVRRIGPLRDARWIKPIGHRCGHHLVELSFSEMVINSKLIRKIVEHFTALKHLEFRYCKFKNLSVNALEQFRELGARLCSLTFYGSRHDENPFERFHLLRHFFRRLQQSISSRINRASHRLEPIPFHLRHLGLPLPLPNQLGNLCSLSNYFSSDLRSLYLDLDEHGDSSDQDQILTKLQRDCSMLTSLYLDLRIDTSTQHLLGRISDLKNLRFLHVFLYDNVDPALLCSCLNNLPNLIGLKLDLTLHKISDVLRSRPFRSLVYLNLYFYEHFYNCEPFGLLSTHAPQLRSLHLSNNNYDHMDDYVDRHMADMLIKHGIECQVLKMANNGILEYLNVPTARFTIEMFEQLIQLCPNLHCFGTRLRFNEQLAQIPELRHIVADQWRAGTRKYLPLQIWIYGKFDKSWPDPFLTIHFTEYSHRFIPPNPVLDSLLRDNLFDHNDSEGTPSFVAEKYRSVTWYIEII